MYRKAMKYKRVRSKVIKVLGRYYFKEMPEKEFYEKQSGFCKRIDNIHTEQELADYLAVEQQIRDPLDTAQYKTIYVPDFNETESAFIFKAHHTFADGLALITLTCNLQDNYHKTQLPAMRKLAFLEKVYLCFALPFSMILVSLKLICKKSDNNAIHNGKPLTGIKRSSISKDIMLDALKTKSKDLGVTINDILMTLTSISIKEYLVSKGDSKTV